MQYHLSYRSISLTSHTACSRILTTLVVAIPIKYDGMGAKKAVQSASLLSELVHMTQKFVASEPEADNRAAAPVLSSGEGPAQQLVTLRLRTLKHEIIVAPG
jgi:hypothetical protein